MNKLPELGEYGVVYKVRSFRREERNSNKEEDKEDRLTEDMSVGSVSGDGGVIWLKLLTWEMGLRVRS